MLNSDVLAVHARPTGLMAADVEMEKAAVVDSDSAFEERWNLQSEFVHLLERKTKDGDVGGDALSVFAIGDAADLLVVRRATVAIVNNDVLACEGAQLLERLDEAAFDFQLTAAMAGQFGFREVLAQIAHVRAPRFLDNSACDRNPQTYF